MSKSINQVILMGRLVRDPEMRTTPSGKTVCSFSLAVDRSFGQDDTADFFNVTAWEKLGELVNQYLAKGRRCLVQGRLMQHSWEKDGQKQSRIDIIANDVTFLDGPSGSTSSAGPSTGSSSAKKPRNADDDNINIEEVEDKPIDLSEIPF
jgi:single-strand DNA-binding protein